MRAWGRPGLCRRAVASRGVWPACLATAVLSGLALSGCGQTAEPATHAPVANPGPICSLQVEITSQGREVLGSVTAKAGTQLYNFSSGSRTIDLGCATRVTLTEVPANSLASPFRGWVIRGGQRDPAPLISLEISGMVQVTASYRLAAALPITSPGTSSPVPSPSPSGS